MVELVEIVHWNVWRIKHNCIAVVVLKHNNGIAVVFIKTQQLYCSCFY